MRHKNAALDVRLWVLCLALLLVSACGGAQLGDTHHERVCTCCNWGVSGVEPRPEDPPPPPRPRACEDILRENSCEECPIPQ